MIYVVSGSRDFPDRSVVAEKIDSVLTKDDVLIHGAARGVDTWCAERAKAIGAVVKPMPANWNLYKKAAGSIRNAEMVAEAVMMGVKYAKKVKAIVFWDGHSKGTKHMMKEIFQRQIDTEVVFP